MLLDVLSVVVGLVLLTVAADRLVLSAARLGREFGLSPVMIGAVVVGLGTSLPEMLVSGIAAARPGGLDLALGNIVGSNVANIALVLGVSAVIYPLRNPRELFAREGVLVLIASVVLAVMAFDGVLGQVEGVVLAIGLLVALVLLVQWGRGADLDVDEFDGDDIVVWREVLLGLGSLVLTLAGARLLVVGAEAVALDLGVSEAVIGLTLVAIGTSLPELATAIAAARRHENDIVIGNVLGSNLFNALGVGGVAGIVGGGALTSSFRGPMVVMLGVTVLAAVLAYWGDNVLTRREGALLLLVYPLALIAA